VHVDLHDEGRLGADVRIRAECELGAGLWQQQQTTNVSVKDNRGEDITIETEVANRNLKQ